MQDQFDVFLKSEQGQAELRAGMGAKGFMHMKSSLVIRDSLRQAVVDHLALRLAVESGLQLSDEKQPLQFEQKHLTGLSLGAITGMGVAAQACQYQDSVQTQEDNVYRFSSVALVAPGMGMPNFLLGSRLFGQLLNQALRQGYESLATKDSPDWSVARDRFILTFDQLAAIVLDNAEPAYFAQALEVTKACQSMPKLVVKMEDDNTIPNHVLHHADDPLEQAAGGVDAVPYVTSLFDLNAGTDPILRVLKSRDGQTKKVNQLGAHAALNKKEGQALREHIIDFMDEAK